MEETVPDYPLEVHSQKILFCINILNIVLAFCLGSIDFGLFQWNSYFDHMLLINATVKAQLSFPGDLH